MMEKIPRERFQEICRQNHLNVTPQREAVYRWLAHSKDHPSTDTLFQMVRETVPAVSFDTVNRTLMTFFRRGLMDEERVDLRRRVARLKESEAGWRRTEGTLREKESRYRTRIENSTGRP